MRSLHNLEQHTHRAVELTPEELTALSLEVSAAETPTPRAVWQRDAILGRIAFEVEQRLVGNLTDAL